MGVQQTWNGNHNFFTTAQKLKVQTQKLALEIAHQNTRNFFSSFHINLNLRNYCRKRNFRAFLHPIMCLIFLYHIVNENQAIMVYGSTAGERAKEYQQSLF